MEPFRVVVLTCDAAGVETARTLHALERVEVAAVLRAPHRRGRLATRIRRVYRTRGIGGFFALALGRLRRLAAAPFRSSTVTADRSPPFPVLHFDDFHSEDCLAALRDLDPHLGVLDGTYILKETVFAIPRLGSINIHCGKVPEYRGAPPAFWELFNGEREAGVTIHRVNARVDQGAVLAEEVFPLDPAPPGDPVEYVRDYWLTVLRPNAVRLLSGVVEGMAAGTASDRPQNSRAGATWKTPSLADVKEIRRRVRARRRSPGPDARGPEASGVETRFEDRGGVVVPMFVVAGIWIAYMLLLPQAPHGDGLRWTRMIELHAIHINPNYLLMEPLAATAYRGWQLLHLPADGNLFQKYLDSLAGALALLLLAMTLLRLRLSTWIVSVTLVLTGFAFNFLYLATSDHIKLLTAPFLAAVFFFGVNYTRTRRHSALVLAGIAMALAVATMINAVLWAVLLGVAFILSERGPLRQRVTPAAVFWTAAAVPAIALFAGVYLGTNSGHGFLQWMSSYGAGPDAQDVGFTGLSLITAGRATFAVVKNFAYSTAIGPMAKGLILGSDSRAALTPAGALNIAATVATVALLLAAAHGLWRARHVLAAADRQVLAICASAVFAFGLFAALWNSGEEEFWFQVTTPAAIAIALWMRYRAPHTVDRAVFLTATVLLVVNNLLTFALPRRAYPYDAHVAEIASAIAPADLVIYDNSEPVGLLMYGVRKREEGHFVAITALLERQQYDLAHALAKLRQELDDARARGGRVWVFDVFEVSRLAHPWSLLSERFGIGPEPIAALLRSRGNYRRATLAGRTVWVLEPSLTLSASPCATIACAWRGHRQR